MNDAVGLPQLPIEIQQAIKSWSVCTFRDFAKELGEFLPNLGTEIFPELKEFQYFCKNHTFRSFNFQDLIYRWYIYLDLLIIIYSDTIYVNEQFLTLDTYQPCWPQCPSGDTSFIWSLSDHRRSGYAKHHSETSGANFSPNYWKHDLSHGSGINWMQWRGVSEDAQVEGVCRQWR